MIPDPTFTKGKHRSGQHWAKVMISCAAAPSPSKASGTRRRKPGKT